MDVFSKFVWLKAIKSKTGKEISRTLSEVYKEAGSFPLRLSTDAGTEFLNKDVAELLARHRVQLFISTSKYGAANAERMVRTVRILLRKMMSSNRRLKGDWSKILPSIAKIINGRKNRMTGYPPAEVTPENSHIVFARLYPILAGQLAQPTKPAFKIGDEVRLLKKSDNTFQKGGAQFVSPDIYTVARVLYHPVLQYRLLDKKTQSIIAGKYSIQELIPVKTPLQ